MDTTKEKNGKQEKLDLEQFKEEAFIEETFKFWFSDHERIRTPFPEHMRARVKSIATDNFMEWIKGLDEEALQEEEELNKETVVQKFEQLIFEAGLEQAKTEDEKISLLFPFMPRIGDAIKESGTENVDNAANSKIVDRAVLQNGDEKYLKVKCEREDGGNWETRFELPV